MAASLICSETVSRLVECLESHLFCLLCNDVKREENVVLLRIIASDGKRGIKQQRVKLNTQVAYGVSSVLNRDVKQFGKKHMFDSNEETCWNSDQASVKLLPQLV
ncbi:UNVERIFIED_CONTAM: hypothetical protein FKN15_005316 [Acipenser sinensis]